jgi:ABC-type transporter Mla MlaB component
MATKDDRPGLLSKVAMFVRNPTRDWSELDQPVDSDASSYDKQVLKAMIERKRQNDFVRKREFDQLRKLRNRDPSAMANMARPSFFQTSLPTDIDGRAGTIKKIDEIEAQMSRQWWKGKSEGASKPQKLSQRSDSTLPPVDIPNTLPSQGNTDDSLSFANTLPVDLQQGEADSADDFLPTQMASGMAGVQRREGLAQNNGRANASTDFSSSRLLAMDATEMDTDPELEEAAIRFANSDDAGAEQCLLSALRGVQRRSFAAHSWIAALLDFYRATQQSASFEAAVSEFALHLDGERPLWSVLGETGAGVPTPAASLAQGASSAVIWDCPASLTAPDMENLRTAMLSTPMPWSLDWHRLDIITPDALELLDALFGSLCEEAVSLHFKGEASLVQALRALTPSGDRNVPQVYWELRLNALRAMRLRDDFELAALDYCVTCEVSPPVWAEAHCSIALADTAGESTTSTAPMAMDAPAPEATLDLVLQGELMGDATQALSVLDRANGTEQCVVIHCGELVRVDFAAAGNILNWVALRQGEGRQVQFHDVHRLVAAFFNVIGINEHAKVALQSI